jgi:arylsulfatase A-like enzyme
MKLFEGPASKVPRYTLVGLYSSDISGHKHGPASPEVKEVLAQFDVFLRDFFKLLKRRGLYEKTYVIVSADHGMHETGELFKIRGALEDKGIRLKSSHPPRRDYALYVANRGVASSHIYIRHDGGFAPMTDLELARHIPTADGRNVDLIETLRGLDATEFVIARSGARSATIFGKDGSRATVRWYGVGGTDYVSYRTRGGDPLGHSKDRGVRRLMDGEPHSTGEWLEATAGERYPDAVVNLSQIFHDGRAGDVFVTSSGRYGFRKMKKGNHGGIVADDMRTPFMMAGPTVPRGRHGAIRPVDVYPLLLSWFGIDAPANSRDGMDPFERRGHGDRQAQRLAAMEMRAELGERLGRRLGLANLASEELARRELLVEKLGTLLEKMYEGGRSKDDPYARDHIAIVERGLAAARADVERMERVAAQLGGRSGT